MTQTRNMTAAMFATLFVTGLMISSASAAVKWSDISFVTHSNAPAVMPTSGRSDAFSPTDLSAMTHASVAAEARHVGRISPTNLRRSDITSVTHN